MPSVSKAQRRAIGIAEHEPGKLYARNRGLLGMSLEDMKEYASTPEAGLPKTVRKGKARKKGKKR